MIEVEVEDEAWRALADVEATAIRAADAALTASHGGDHAGRPTAKDVSLLLTGDVEVQALNARFRDKDAPTNVLSFPAAESAYPHLGDIALAYGVCAREAAAQGKGLADHLAHLVVHGVLHLLDYDHLDDTTADAMEAEERAILRHLGVADPYGQDRAHV